MLDLNTLERRVQVGRGASLGDVELGVGGEVSSLDTVVEVVREVGEGVMGSTRLFDAFLDGGDVDFLGGFLTLIISRCLLL